MSCRADLFISMLVVANAGLLSDADIFGFAEEDRRIAEEKSKGNKLRRLLSLPSWLGGTSRSDGAGQENGQSPPLR